MQLTKGAIGNLINRYKAVLKKCHLLNVFGSLAVAGMLVMGGAGVAVAEGSWMKPNGETAQWTNGVVLNGTVLQGTYKGFSQAEETLAGVATVDYTTTGVSVANETTFTSNSKTAGAAGALKLLNGIKIGDNVKFENNKAESPAWGGGALYIKLVKPSSSTTQATPSAVQEVTIGAKAVFTGNEASSLGGAIALEYGRLTIKEGALFKDNKAATGGAIAMWHDASTNGETSGSLLNISNAAFIGNKATIDGGALSLADTAGGKVTITDSQFDRNSSGSMGGAIFNSGTLTVNDGSFDGNKAGNGGAIYNATNATLKITGTSFTNNTAAGWGGAILNSGATITVTDATFANNIAQGGAGGAIGNPAEGPSSVTISGTKFLNNHSVYDGGAIGNYGGMKIENCLFEGNTAQLDFDGENGTWTKSVTDPLDVGGGAISLGAVSDSAVASISGTTFKNNISGKNGGAIATRQAAHADNSAAKLDIAATFIGNKAQQGGAIYNSFYTDNGLGKGAGVTVTGTFSGNEATGKGGAIYNDGTLDKNSTKPSGGVMTITDATFDNNKADFVGGAIFNSGTLTVNDGSFDGNKAGNGGAIYNATNATLKITGTSFTNNTAAGWGGAILNSGATITVTDATFANNIAQGGAGGAIGNPAEGPSSVTISGTKFLNNHSVYDGGAIGNYGGMKIENCLFEGNTAQLDFDGENGTWTKSVTDPLDVGGGAISLGAVSDSAVASISGTTFKNNISGKNGGAIATRQAAHADNSAAKLDIAATFIGNKAQQGGAIYNSFYTDNGLGKGAGVTVTGTFSGNEATSKGGAIYNDGTLDKNSTKPSGGIMTITDATFDGNKANYGGAIFNTGKMTVNGGGFEGNTAAKAAGAIYNAAGATLTVDGVTFANNSSAKAGAINSIAGKNEGTTTTIKNSKFNNNSAVNGMGGALANSSNAESGSTEDFSGKMTLTDTTFSGNTARNGGALWNDVQWTVDITGGSFDNNSAVTPAGSTYPAQGGAISNSGTLNISGVTFSNNKTDGLGGAIYNTKTGGDAGSITFNGTNTFTNNTAAGKANDIYNDGTITVAGGTTTLNSGLILAANSTTTVSGGALVINGTTTWEAKEGAVLGSLTVNGSTLTLQKDDVLADNYKDLAVQLTAPAQPLSVTSGSLYLINNSNYTAENFTDAKTALTLKDVLQTNSSFGFVGGTLIGADNKATDLVVDSNMINSVTTFKEDTVLAGTEVHNNSFLQNDLTVEAGTNAPVTITGADVAVNKVNIKITEPATGEKTLTINNGSLTVVGGNANDTLIAANGNALTTITVNSNSELNLGSAAIPERGAGTLGSAEIALDSNGSLNASNGDYTVGDVTGDVIGTDAVTANTGANLNTGKINVNAVTADAANIKATGDVEANTIDLVKGGSVTSSKNIKVNSSIEDADGTLQAGESITAAGQNLTQADNGKLTVVAGGTIKAANISATNVAAKTLTADAVAVDGGTLKLTGTGTDASTVKSLKLTNGTQASIAGSLTLGGATETLTVGTGDDTAGGTTLSAQHIDLNGGMLLVDPAWGQASSNVAVESLSAGDVGVGQNSYLALGTADTGWLPGVVGNYTKGVGLSETGITAALGVYKGLTIGTGKALLVDGSKMDTATDPALTNAVNAAADDSATFADNSLLVVNGADAGIAAGGAAITFGAPGGGTLTVSEGAKLLVTDAVAGQTYTIVGNVATSTVDGWKNNGMTSTTDMISLGNAVFDAPNNEVITAATRNDAHTVFPNLSDGMANAVNDLYTGRKDSTGKSVDYADVNSADMGVRFLSRATDNRFLGMDKEAAAATIESAARIAFAGAVPQMTKMASDAGTNAVVNRLGFADPADGAQAMDADGKIVDRNTTGFALWIAPLWQSQHGWGMDADSMDYGFNGNLGGVSLGADYTFENAIRAGITFNIGGGYAESSGGDLSSTDNRMNFWGLGAYAGWNYENFGVMADVSYTSTWNDLKQDVDSRMGMGDLEADVQATAISAGLRAEYLLQTSAMDIIPHIGVRYMSLNTWGYDVDTHGGTVLEGDSLHQDIWTFPIGVTFSKDFALDSGWSFKPSLDFTVIPAAGDIKAKHDVHFTGLPGTYEVETQMMDYLTWQGGVGLELANDNMSIGVNYTLQAGQHTTGHGVFGSFRYEF